MMTAIEFLRRDESGVYNEQDIAYAMVEFAKMHCEAQAKTIQESAYIVTTRDKFRQITSCKINRESIVTAYPLENIK
jgi:hypothetical protein